MLCFEMRYFNLNRILLLTIGVWPYERSKLARFRFILFFGILTSFIVVQFTAFVTLEFSIDLIIKIGSSSCFFICLMVKYNSFWININIVRQSLDRLQHICNKLKNDMEITILEKYGNTAELYTTAFLLAGLCGVLIVLLPSIWPCILDIILPMNESRPHPSLQILTEYFIDQEKYFYLIMLHRNAAFCIGCAAIISTGSFLLAYFYYICGLFSIASFRIENALDIDILQDVSREKQLVICKKMIYAIDIHRTATESSTFLISNFEASFFLLITSGLICLSSNLARVASSGGDIEEILISCGFLTTLSIYLFFSNYTAQTVTDHNELVFTTVYSVQWYIAPLRVQKIILFLLQRGTKVFTLNLGGIFVGSLESAAMLASASISYFTVLYSTRHNY